MRNRDDDRYIPEHPRQHVYLHEGHAVGVVQGLGDGTFMAAWLGNGGETMHRVKSPMLPVTEDRDTAQLSLNAWAGKKGLPEVQAATEEYAEFVAVWDKEEAAAQEFAADDAATAADDSAQPEAPTTAPTVTPEAPALTVGDEVEYQTGEMPEARHGRVVRIIEGGWMVNDGSWPRVVKATDFIRRIEQMPGDGVLPSPATPAGAHSAESSGDGVGATAPSADATPAVPVAPCEGVQGKPQDAVALGVPAVPAVALEAVTGEIRELIGRGRLAATRIAVLIAQARESCFADDATGWLAWAQQEFGYERRFCFSLLKAGTWLVQHTALGPGVHSNALLAQPVECIEIVANVPEQHLDRFLKRHPDLAGMPRDQLRRAAKAWAENKTVAEIEQQEADAEVAKVDAAKARKESRALAAPITALQVLAKLAHAAPTERLRIGADVPAMQAVHAGFVALDIAAMEFAKAPPSDQQRAQIQELLSQFATALNLATEA